MEKYKLRKIITKRKFCPQRYWQVAYEWEDIFSQVLDIPLVSEKKYKILPSLNIFLKYYYYFLSFCSKTLGLNKKMETDLSLIFQMNMRNALKYTPKQKRGLVPYIVDGFISEQDLPYIYTMYHPCPLVLVSSIEVFYYLKEMNCPLNIQFLPLSLPDNHKLDTSVRYEKKYDVISPGRPNPILDEFMERYLKDNPEVEYVSCKKVESDNSDNVYEYYSSKTGRLNSDFSTRESYVNFVRSGKITMYSTQGVSNKNVSKGFNPVTPRFFETLTAQNQIIAIYPQTVETSFFELETICPSIDTYEKFKERMDKYLQSEVNLDFYSQYLEKHYTSKRAVELQKMIDDLL